MISGWRRVCIEDASNVDTPSGRMLIMLRLSAQVGMGERSTIHTIVGVWPDSPILGALAFALGVDVLTLVRRPDYYVGREVLGHIKAQFSTWQSPNPVNGVVDYAPVDEGMAVSE